MQCLIPYLVAYKEVTEGAPLNALSEVWPYILSCVLSLTSGKREILELSVFTGMLSIPLRGFLQIPYFSSA